MALLKHAGTLPQDKARINKEETTTDRLIPNPTLPLVDDRDMAQVMPLRDTFHNRTSFNPERYPDLLDLINGYVEGSRIKVTFYSTDWSDATIRSHETDFNIDRDKVHYNFLKILNYELTLTSPLPISFNPDASILEMTGEAITFPGLEPHLGDVFLYELGDHNVGLFTITDKEPLSIRQGTCYKINVLLKHYVGPSDIKKLEEQVIETCVFDRQKYLTTNHVLLTHKSYSVLKQLEALKDEILKRYLRYFYDENIQSVIRPDGLYDPYVVKYLLKKLSIKLIPKRPLLLITYLPDFEQSLWGILLDRNNGYELEEVKRNYRTVNHYVGIYHTDINPLINKNYVTLTSDEITETPTIKNTSPQPYGFNPSFYSCHRPSVEESLIINVIKGKDFSVTKVLELVQNYKRLSDMDKFYYMPLYIFLIEESLKKI